MYEEKRKKTRVPFVAKVILKTGDSEIEAEATTKDISMNGVFVRTEKMIPVGTPCDIEILLTGASTKLSVNVKGSITRQDKSGMGIGFILVHVDSYVHLRNIVMYNAPDPDAIEKETFSIE